MQVVADCLGQQRAQGDAVDCDLPAAIRELRAMQVEISGFGSQRYSCDSSSPAE
ncbi:hypothetical protein GTY73_15830 [Streptomyces sp. SID8354]|nr:hypothetical protein [Streptomyces sp. SID8354]